MFENNSPALLSYNLLLKGMPGLYIFLNPEFKIISISNDLRKTFNIEEDIEGKTIFDFYSNRFRSLNLPEIISESLQRVTNTFIPERNNFSFHNRDLIKGFCNTPVYNDSEELYCIIHEIFVSDEPGRIASFNLPNSYPVQSFEELSPSFYEEVLNNSFNGIMAYKALRDENNNIIDFECILANKPSELFTGVPSLLIKGRKLSDIWKNCNPQDIIANYRKLVEEGGELSYERQFERNGVTKWFYAFAKPLGDGYTITFEDITERKLAEENLKGVLNSSLSGIVALKAQRDGSNKIIDFNFIFANYKFEELIERPSSEIIGKSILKGLPQEEQYELLDKLISVVESGNSIDYETTFSTSDRKKWFQAVLVKLNDGVVITAYDITARKNAESRLEESRKYTESLIENSIDGVVALDSNLNYIEWNPFMEDLIGLKKEQVIGRNLKDVFQQQDTDEYKGFLEALDGKKSFFKDRTYPGIKGIYDSCILPLTDRHSNIIGVLSIIHNVTERNESEARLKESQHFIRQVAETIPNVLYVYDLEKQQNVYCNKEIQEMIGYSRDEIAEKSSLTLMHPDDRKIFNQKSQRYNSLKDSEVIETRIRYMGATGDWKWILSREMIFKRNDSGEVTQILGIAQDISGELEATQKIINSEQQLNEAQNIAHLGSWEWDIIEDKVFWSDEMFRIFGYSPDEIIVNANTYFQHIHPEHRRLVKKSILSSIKMQASYTFQCKIRTKSEQVKWILAKGKVISSVVGKVIKLGGTALDITELKEAEEKIIKNETLLINLLHSAPDGVITMDEQGTIKEWNLRSEAIFGWEKEEVTGHNFEDVVIPERYREAHRAVMNQLIHSNYGAVVNMKVELYGLKKDLSEIPIELTISSIFIENRYTFILFIRDISERRQAEESIRKSELLLSEAEKIAHYGSWEWDIRSNEITWSDEMFRIFGMDPRQVNITYENYLSYIHPEEAEFFEDTLKNSLVSNTPFLLEHKIINAEGMVKVLQTRGKVVYNESKEPLKILGSSFDITEQKEVSQQILKSEGLYKTLSKNLPHTAVVLFDKDLIISLADGSALEAIRFDTNLIGQATVGHAFEIDDSAYIENPFHNALKGEHATIEKELFGRVYKIDIMPVKNSEGEIFAGMALAQDITEVKQYQKELEIRIEKLNRSNEELEQFAYVASHDLQEPLRKIRAFGDRLSHKFSGELGEDGKDYIERMQNAAGRMQVLIDDLLAYSRLSRSQEEYMPTDLSLVVADVLNDLEITIEQKGARIHCDALPTILAIQGQMRQLFQNLISNALKFQRTGVTPEISIKHEIITGRDIKGINRIYRKNKYVRIYIQDNGIGFEEKYLDRIFIIFQRLHGKSEYAGTGIGLAICKKIVENHHGFIDAQSQVNQGSIFMITLPIQGQYYEQLYLEI